MASERITVMEEFLDENAQLPDDLKRMAISSAYYQAARLVYFDRGIPGRKFLFRALYSYPANIFSFEWRVLLYIFMAPLSAFLLKVLKRLGIFRKLPNNA